MKLLEPLVIGRGPAGAVTAPSRVLFGPHETNLGNGRSFSARHVAYYARRGAGGAGIIVTEEASVLESDWPYERAPLARECRIGWKAIADACAPHGTVVLAALGHSGGQGTSHWSQRELWAPSPVPEVASREVPKVMEEADIQAVIAGFRDATIAAINTGVHGVEINVGQFSLVRQFASALTNQRGDEWGSDRSRFAHEVLHAVRTAAGDAIVALRISVDEMAPWAGIVPEAGAALTVELAPFVDLITVVRGSIYTGWATRPDQNVEPGFAIDLARTVRTALRTAGHDVPVVAHGSIVEWGQAEWAIDSGAADAVEMTRAQLADADLVVKLRANQSARIRPCLLCNQTCKVRDNRNPIITCVVDPRTGHETQDQADGAQRAANGRRLTVVGGGIAGLEAARVAALRGFAVTVLESTNVLGGVVRAASANAGMARLAAIADWLVAEVDRLGVAVELGRRVNNDELLALRSTGPVIIASGATHGTRPFTVDDAAVVCEAVDVLRGDVMVPDGPVALWDPIGGPIAVGLAELLAGQGRSVTLITPDLLVGEKLALTGDLAPVQVRLHGLGVTLVKRALVRAVRDGKVEAEDRFSGDALVIEAAVLIACGHRLPDTMLDPDEQLVQVGDRVAPRTIHEAILEGRRAALRVRGS